VQACRQAIQVLTNNLLYDFSQTTIPTDNVDAKYLAVPRRWDIGNITKFVLSSSSPPTADRKRCSKYQSAFTAWIV
jgi:hypothetical protein